MTRPTSKVARVIPIRAVVEEGRATAAPSPASELGASLYEKQKKIYVRSMRGWFASWRWAMVFVTQAVFYGIPWVTWNGRPAVLFDLAARRFFLFDLVLYPQDFIYLSALLIACAYSLFFFTAIGGRLWCGYACPQTVYTEIFRWVERRFEGDRGAHVRRDAAGWSVDKTLRKTGKHATWLTIAWWTGFTFVGYFTPIRTLWGEAFTLSFGPWEWFWVNFYGLATYGNAGFLREQVCKYMCPYAHFQSAMFDKDTMIVSYDTTRGEPRGKRARGSDTAALGVGDCIDCGLCVQVCPMGIDIRDGLQYECTACTACIDACNGVMTKMHYPQGLIRYATERGLAQKSTQREMFRRVLRPRVLIYATVLMVIASAFVFGVASRDPVRVDVVRDRVTLARIVDHGEIENVYRLQLMNATEFEQDARLRVDGMQGASLAGFAEVHLLPAEARWVTLAVRVPADAASAAGPGSHPIVFVTTLERDARPVRERSTFIVPR